MDSLIILILLDKKGQVCVCMCVHVCEYEQHALHICMSKPPASSSHLASLVYQGDMCKTQLETEGTEYSGIDIVVPILKRTFRILSHD